MMDGNSEGGPVHPALELSMDSEGRTTTYSYSAEGLMVRDWFAGQSLSMMPSLLGLMDIQGVDHVTIARHAYKLADAMIAERDGYLGGAENE